MVNLLLLAVALLLLLVSLVLVGVGSGGTGLWMPHYPDNSDKRPRLKLTLPAVSTHTNMNTVVEAPNRLRRESSNDSSTSTTTTTPAADVQVEELFLKHTHAIPNILIFTHYTNLLKYDDSNDNSNNNDNNNTTASDSRKELRALSDNVRHAIALHPGAQVRFLTDDDCVHSLKAVMGHSSDYGESATRDHTDSLVYYFRQETVGMYKADLCRGAALWETGGLYFDVDLGVRMNIFDVLQEDTTFATNKVHLQSKHKGAFFQAFMGATPQNPILYRYLELFQTYYQGLLRPPLPDGPLGVLLLRRAYDEVLARDRDDEDHDQNKQDSSVVTTTVDKNTVEIWQELLYLPRFQKSILSHVPPPVWGTRRACKFVVIAGLEEPFVVPFYSRVANSRMCPAQPPGDMGIYAAESKEEEVEEEEEGTSYGEESSDGEEKAEEE
jgi:hypothetical protein